MKYILLIFTIMSMAFIGEGYSHTNTDIKKEVTCIVCRNGIPDAINQIKKNHNSIAKSIAKAECPKFASFASQNTCSLIISKLLQDVSTWKPNAQKLCETLSFCKKSHKN